MTLRLRLTALYSGLVLLAGSSIVILTYILVDQRVPKMAGVSSLTELAALTKLQGLDKTAVAGRLTAFFTQYRAETLESLLRESAIALGIVTVFAILLGWFIAGRALAPIGRITETARRVADHSLHERIGMKGPKDELTELASTFDEMLERLDRSFDGQRRFVGNAAHELRTPLTINRTLLEVALARPEASDDLRSLGSTLLSVNQRHERLIDGLLLLARSDSELRDAIDVDLAEVVKHLIEANPTGEGSPEIRLSVRKTVVAGDPVLLERLVYNLLDNAKRYNRTDGWVGISSQVDDSGPMLTVHNTGPAIASYEIPGLFEPFRRGTDRVPSSSELNRADRGVGLGLSIVRSVAVAHGGSVDASPREGGGLTVEVRFPRAV